MSAAAVVAAVCLLLVDAALPNSALDHKWFILQVSPSEARTFLSTVASAVLGIVGVVFSITLVPLTIAMSQFGPMLLRKFMRDTTTQVMLGSFSATFVYCIALLLTFPQNMTSQTTPQVAVTFALLLFLSSIGLLVLFFHHTATSLQASNVVARVSAELHRSIERDYLADQTVAAAQRQPGDTDAAEARRATVLREGHPIAAAGMGYIHAIDGAALLRVAEAHQLTMVVTRMTGDFVIVGDPLVMAWPPQHVTDGVAKAVNRAWLLGEYRTMVQDIEFGITSLVSVALMALSPAINNASTAILCLDRLAAALSALAGRHRPAPYYYDRGGRLRIVADATSFPRLTDIAFNQIRQYGCRDAEVLRHMHKAIARIAPYVKTEADREALLRHAALVEHAARLSLPEEQDQERVRQSYEVAIQAIGLCEASRARPAGRAAAGGPDVDVNRRVPGIE